ncbi:MAG: PadR family transcriptional regulator [Armatimonadota bacterium]
MKAWITQLRKGLFELLLLNVIARGESYGYEIVQQLRQVSAFQVTESTVYPILERLHKDGYVGVRREPSPTGPMRRYYSLTTAGKYRVAEMNDYWDSLNKSVAELRKMPKGESQNEQPS